MARRKGKISKIGKSKYSFFVQLDGDGHYFNTKYNPKAGVGDIVGITYEPKGDQRSQVKDIKLLEDNGGPKGYQESSGGGGGGRSGNGYQADPDRQMSIVYQSSRKDALQLAEIIVSNEAIKLPKAPDGRRTVIEELVSELTLRMFAEAMDPKKATASASKVEEDAKGGDEDDEDWDDSDEGGSDDDWDSGDDWE